MKSEMFEGLGGEAEEERGDFEEEEDVSFSFFFSAGN